MMENRSFDHFLGWLPGADGKQAGLTYTDADGVAHADVPARARLPGLLIDDPDHSYDGARVEWNNGACDGWLRAGENDAFSIGYYQQAISRSSAARRRRSRRATATSRRSSARRSRTASTCTRRHRPARQRRSRVDTADDLGPARRRG